MALNNVNRILQQTKQQQQNLTLLQSSSNVLNSTCPHVLSNFKSLPRCVMVRGRTTSFSWLDIILNTRFSSSSALHCDFLHNFVMD